MELTLYRNPDPTLNYTAGRLFIDGLFCFYTLEDQVREVANKPVSAWKVPGETAIPRGSYKIILSDSPKFSRLLPELLNVPGYSKVRLHAGNTTKDTEGCILVGLQDGNSKDAWLGNSRAAENALMKRLLSVPKGEEIWITVK